MRLMLFHLYLLCFDFGYEKQLVFDKFLEERVLKLIEEELVSLLIAEN
jgi:hypothetical protein